MIVRCVKILAADHRYKLLMNEKKSNKQKRLEDGTEGDAPAEKPPKKAKSKAKSKAAAQKS